MVGALRSTAVVAFDATQPFMQALRPMGRCTRIRNPSQAMWETMASPKALQESSVASSIKRSKS